MPILAQQPDLYPDDLLTVALDRLDQSARDEDPLLDTGRLRWWAIYTRSRHEKQLMRHLTAQRIPYYCPLVPRRYRSPAGRIRTVYDPLFANYVFLFGDNEQRYQAMTTNCVSKWTEVSDGLRLTEDLRQIRELIEVGEPLTPEARLVPGQRVRVKTGNFAGFEGTILRREGETRLLVSVAFMQQGASVLLDDCQLECC